MCFGKVGFPKRFKTKPTGHFKCGGVGPCTDEGILSKKRRCYTHFKTILLEWTKQTWLSGYASSSWKHVDGTKDHIHPIHSYSLCCSLFRALKESDRADVKPFDGPVFAAFTSTLDAQMKAVKSSAMHQHRQAEVILSEDMEDTLWGKGLFGGSSPQQLLDTLVFYIGLYFVLRSGSEDHRLRHHPLQIQLVELPNGSAHLVYRESVSKTNQGGLKQCKKAPKEVIQKENKDDPRRCLI